MCRKTCSLSLRARRIIDSNALMPGRELEGGARMRFWRSCGTKLEPTRCLARLLLVLNGTRAAGDVDAGKAALRGLAQAIRNKTAATEFSVVSDGSLLLNQMSALGSSVV